MRTLTQLPCIAGFSTVLLFAAVSFSDRTFMAKASQGGMAEVELGQLAASKATNQKVKDFGQRMVDDHSKANDQLKSIASNKGVSLPSDISSKERALIERLSQMSGDTFDKAYMRAMVDDHKTDIAEFEKEANGGQDSDLKTFASSTLPTLKAHLDLANDAAKAVGVH
jgi:putative membrane protein